MGYSKRPQRPRRPTERPRAATPRPRRGPAAQGRGRLDGTRRRDEAADESRPRAGQGRTRSESSAESRPRTGQGRPLPDAAPESRRRAEAARGSRPPKPKAGSRSRASQYQHATRKRVPKPKLEVRWLNLRPLFDFWGNRIPRYYGLNALTRATEGVLHGNDRFIVPSIQQVLGPAPLVSLTFELFQEGQFQLIFLARAVNARRNTGAFAYVVAKRPGDFSKLAAAEHENLRLLHERAPDHVVRPYRGGRVILFDRRLGDGPREVYAYLTQWLGSHHELGVARNLQFYVNIQPHQLFSVPQTEDIKGQILEVIARSYDPGKRTCMEMPQIASGDFVATLPSQGRPRIKLIACRRLLHNMTPEKVVHRILEAHWDWGGRDFRLAPDHPETAAAAFERALGKEAAQLWIAEYQARFNQNRR